MQKHLDSKFVNSGANYSSYDSRDTPQPMDKKFTTLSNHILNKEMTPSEMRDCRIVTSQMKVKRYSMKN